MKNEIVLFLLLISKLSFCQSPELSNPKPFFISISISNIDTSIQWYHNNLGMTVKNRIDSRERGFKQANLERFQMQIELVELDSSISRHEEILKAFGGRSIQGFTKFGFTVIDFNNWYSFFSEKKVKFVGSIIKNESTGKRMFLVSDPDGNLIQVFEN